MRILLLFLIASYLTSCKQLGTNEHLIYGGEANVHIILIQNFSFKPATLEVEDGDILRFINLDTDPHNVVPRLNSPFQFTKSRDLNKNDAFELRIGATEADIYCSLHPNMPGFMVFVR